MVPQPASGRPFAARSGSRTPQALPVLSLVRQISAVPGWTALPAAPYWKPKAVTP
jgi:hypothetical protein